MPVVMTGCFSLTQLPVAASKRSAVPCGEPDWGGRAAALVDHEDDADLRVVDGRVVAQRDVDLGRRVAGLEVPDGMPLSATEILASAGTGSNGSAVGSGADDGLTSQPPA